MKERKELSPKLSSDKIAGDSLLFGLLLGKSLS